MIAKQVVGIVGLTGAAIRVACHGVSIPETLIIRTGKLKFAEVAPA